MDPTDLLCNGILFLIFMLFAVLAIKHSPGGIVGVIIWAVVIIIVIGFIVYLTFGMLDMALLGLMMAQKNRAQLLNPRTGRWVKIDTKKGGIVHHKQSPGPFKNVKKYRRRKR